MNWGECKLYALQKIDPAVESLTPSRNTKAYLNAMVAPTNRGLQDLSTVGKYIVKSFDITQSEPKNILPSPISMLEIFTHKIDTEYSADGATAYYFELDGNAIVEIYVDGIVVETISNDAKGFNAFKGFIPNDKKKNVTLKFTGPYHYQYRNIALYDTVFANVEEIWDFVSEKRYPLRTILSDFYKLLTTDVVLQSGYSNVRYNKTTNFYWEGDSTLVLCGLEKGSWKVHYYAYPQEITISTTDETELSLDPEVAALLPVYIASELMEDDDMDVAFYFREQYEAGKQRLRPTRNIGRATFNDVNGW